MSRRMSERELRFSEELVKRHPSVPLETLIRSPEPAETAEVPILRVLMLNTGGTISMKMSPDGFVPDPFFIRQYLRRLPQFCDHKFLYGSTTSKTGLVTPISEFGRRIYYEILEYDPLLDSSNMVSWETLLVSQKVSAFVNIFLHCRLNRTGPRLPRILICFTKILMALWSFTAPILWPTRPRRCHLCWKIWANQSFSRALRCL